MKKIILTIGIILASFGLNLSYAQNNNIENYQISNSLEQKVDNVLGKFYIKIEKKYNLTSRIKKLTNINQKIDEIVAKSHNKLLVNVLKYLKYKLNQKFLEYEKEYHKQFKKPSFCTMEYAPVCAIIKQNTIRCIKAPCPDNGIYKTFSNNCMAKKSGYKISYKGKCKNKNYIILGGDKYKHGCIGSAGYSWCAIKNKCIRPWEEKCINK